MAGGTGIVGTSGAVSNSTFVWTVPASNAVILAGSNSAIFFPVATGSNTGTVFVSSTNSSFSVGYNNFTIEGWYNVQTGAANWSNSSLFCLFNGAAPNPYQYVYLQYGAGTYGVFYNGAVAGYTSNYPDANNSWNHIALVRSGATTSGGSGNLTLYRNGTSIINVPLSGAGPTSIMNISAANTLYVGATPANSTFYWGSWQGMLSDFRFCNTAVYTGSFSPPPRGTLSTSQGGAGSNVAPIVSTSTLSLVKPVAGVANDIVNTTSVTLGNTVTALAPTGLGGTAAPSNVAASWTFGGTSSIATAVGSPYYALGNLFTIETWVYPSNFTSTPRVICQSNSTNSIDVALTTTGYVTCCNGRFTTTTQAMTASNWYHVAVVCANGVPSVYINGTSATLTGTTSGINLTDTANTIQVGAGPGALTKFTGQIGGVRILKGTALYTSNFTKPSTYFTNITNTVLLMLPDYSTLDHSFLFANTTATTISYSTSLKPF
jgi:hypothetical protein